MFKFMIIVLLVSALSISLTFLGAKCKIAHNLKRRSKAMVRRTLRIRRDVGLSLEERQAEFEARVQEARQFYPDTIAHIVHQNLSGQLVGIPAVQALLHFTNGGCKEELISVLLSLITKAGAVAKLAVLVSHLAEADSEFRFLIAKSLSKVQHLIDGKEKASQLGAFFGKLYKAKAFGIEVLRDFDVSASTTDFEMEFLLCFFLELETLLLIENAKLDFFERYFHGIKEDSGRAVVDNMAHFFCGSGQESEEKWVFFTKEFMRRAKSANRVEWAFLHLLDLARGTSTCDACVQGIDDYPF